jgi:hypothetical protein
MADVKINSRYIFKYGFIVTDDVVRRAISTKAIPLCGTWIIRLNKPLPCVFVTAGNNGIYMDDVPFSVISDLNLLPTKEERFALHKLMLAFDPDFKLKLKSSWVFIDQKAADCKVIRAPVGAEVSSLKRCMLDSRAKDRGHYKTVCRVQRRATTQAADEPDGHENDSDKSPTVLMIDDLMEKEKRADKARQTRVGLFGDTEGGRALCKIIKKQSLIKRRADVAFGAGLEDSKTDCVAVVPPQSPHLPPSSKRPYRKKKEEAVPVDSKSQQSEDLFGDSFQPTPVPPDTAKTRSLSSRATARVSKTGPKEPQEGRPSERLGTPVGPNPYDSCQIDRDYYADEDDYDDLERTGGDAPKPKEDDGGSDEEVDYCSSSPDPCRDSAAED